MTCPMQSRENAEILLEYCARSLPADTLARFDAHVAMCPSCRQELGAQQQLWTALDEFDATDLNISADFDRRLYARIEAEHQEPFWVRGWRNFFRSGQPGAWRPGFSMALAGVAVVALLLVRLPATFSPVNVESPVATSAAEESVDPALKTATLDKQFDKQDVEGLDTALEDLEMLHVLGSSPATGKMNSL